MNKRMASIFCDGACSGNGTRAAYGGWAWAFWPGEAMGEPKHYGSGKLKILTSEGVTVAATNQRAELTALHESLKWAAAHPEYKLTIYTDSMYAINCTTKWGSGWKRKGWRRDSGEPLQNLDLIKPLVDLWKPQWPLVHVRGHQTGSSPAVHGNNWVDRAAVAGAKGEGGCSIPRVNTKDVLALDIPSPPVLSPSPDLIEHVESAFPVKPVKKLVKAADVKQSDIRNWFR